MSEFPVWQLGNDNGGVKSTYTPLYWVSSSLCIEALCLLLLSFTLIGSGSDNTDIVLNSVFTWSPLQYTIYKDTFCEDGGGVGVVEHGTVFTGITEGLLLIDKGSTPGVLINFS